MLPQHIWTTERFFFVSLSLSLLFPCFGVINITQQCDICETLFISPNLSPAAALCMIWCLLTGLTPGSQVCPERRCFSLLCGEKQVATGLQVHEPSLGTFQKVSNKSRIYKNVPFYTEK